MNSTGQPSSVAPTPGLDAWSTVPEPSTSITPASNATDVDKYGHPASAETAAEVAAALPESQERVRFVHIAKTGGGAIEDAALVNGHLWG